MNKKTKKISFWVIMTIALIVIGYGAIIVVKSVPSRDAVVLVEPVNDSDWSIGPKDAKVTIVEYSDFQCPACGFYAPIIKASMEKFASQSVRLVYRHYPLPQHKNARLASTYAESAGRQGKFWEMANILFDKQKAWSDLGSAEAEAEFINYAQSLNLNIPKVKIDVKDSAIATEIQNDQTSGIKSGVNSTPTFFINGTQVDIKPTNDSFNSTIEKYLQ